MWVFHSVYVASLLVRSFLSVNWKLPSWSHVIGRYWNLLDLLFKPLEGSKKFLAVYFSSAFSTIQPHLLATDVFPPCHVCCEQSLYHRRMWRPHVNMFLVTFSVHIGPFPQVMYCPFCRNELAGCIASSCGSCGRDIGRLAPSVKDGKLFPKCISQVLEFKCIIYVVPC